MDNFAELLSLESLEVMSSFFYLSFSPFFKAYFIVCNSAKCISLDLVSLLVFCFFFSRGRTFRKDKVLHSHLAKRFQECRPELFTRR